MDFAFSPEQEQLRDSVAAYLRDRYPFETRRAIALSDRGWSEPVWRDFADRLGLLSLADPDAPPPDPVDLMVVVEQFGAALVIEPFLETVVTGASLLRASGTDTARTLLRGIAAGDERLALAWGEPGTRHGWAAARTVATRDGAGWRLDGVKSVVIGAPWATTLLVAARAPEGVLVFAVDPAAPGLTAHPYPTIDGRRAADLRFDHVPLDPSALLLDADRALPALEAVGDASVAALCAEAVGVTGRMLDDTIAYTRERRQFGQPISQFQALQHRMVDMYMKREMAASAVYLATLSLGAPARERARAASVAKVTVGEACRFIGQHAIQLHGGMGMTDALAVGHYFKRATVIEGEFGSPDDHLARFAALTETSRKMPAA
ncbi:pimeloyl-CoA dehydrogenase small subunit [Sphingomonas sp. CL5.1]|uniref:acyl-CoA dehydrogenase family protein n=1 Tax=Sphingomonas sp. CL5.1 TaxID=2653203 RepID=UPI0015822B54|nr:acyl-CoA dehydrogenase family protein [Sphingomonas sp. CL5.1]QKR98409.1 pimeloyl-CoA dehydrogenase small subunit [Sphingomonas sp. CL5.1]